MIFAFTTARCCQSYSWQRPIQHDMANLAASRLTSIKQQIGPSAQNALYVSRSWENGRAPTRLGYRCASEENFNELATAGRIILHDAADFLNESPVQ
jgi:hypothetical protein